ncbi:ABC transporter ATP-binding protein [Oceanidesulfovibrio marinus]|uniref:ATP-binding cassette domain-containing protein n=1 Tax=Oceanidesulfovibrio marinus TaxID=370038 RepID=A0ABX6NHB6_9BACT|nr:ATP-binding cassette domain-containing protein [Oceanidesulfovibrio marinus]QJT10034.1 ATP-binding cassette domain-containing protein [Oceanidesulfovibrio marinus]
MPSEETTTYLNRAPDIVLDNLKLGYGDNIVLEHVDVVLPASKISVILGGSGGGKSTLLRHILGLEHPMRGRIMINDRNIFDLDEKQGHDLRGEMGVLFQNGALLGSLTLGENVALPLREHTELDEETIETLVRIKLNLVGLDKFMDYYPSQLSGGMRKRAGLARALVLDPNILLCDEPTSGLDPITAAELDQLILDLHDTFNMTIVVVTHDLDSLFAIADFVVMLHNGNVLFQGGLDALKKSKHEFIKQFLGREPGERHSPDFL